MPRYLKPPVVPPAPVVIDETRREQRGRLRELTEKASQFYTALDKIADERGRIVVSEMNAGATAKELGEIMGVGQNRVYKLRDAWLRRGKD